MSFNYAEEILGLRNKERDALDAGKADGTDEAPSSADEQFNASQLDIKFEVQKVARHLISDTKTTTLGYITQLNSQESALRNGVALPDLENIKASSEQELRVLTSECGPTFIDKLLEFWRAEKRIANFKRDKGIPDGPENAPDSVKAHYMTIVAYAVIETIVNVFIFNAGLSGFDAFLLSTFISVLNILPAVVVGNYYRNINGGSTLSKRLAVTTLVAWLLFLLWLNTSLAILRSFLTASNSAEANLFNNPEIFQIFFRDAFSVFSLQAPPIRDVLSIMLWLVGILAGVLACWKGYTSDEKIPELGKLNRDYKIHKEELHSLEVKMRDALSAIISNKTSIFQRVRNEFETNRRDYKSGIQLLGQKISEYDRQLKEIEGQYKHLINLYREGNKSTRKSYPPEYFGENEPDLGVDNLPDFSDFSETRINERIAIIEELFQVKVNDLNALQTQFNEFIDELHKKFEAKMTAFDDEARRRIQKDW